MRVAHPYDGSDTLDKPCYDYKGLSRSRAYIEKLVASLQAVGFDVYQIDHEDANGQFEINYTPYTDCLTSADRYIFLAASEIAKEMGLICSFMPSPLPIAPATECISTCQFPMVKKICLPMTAIHGVGTFQTGLSL